MSLPPNRILPSRLMCSSAPSTVSLKIVADFDLILRNANVVLEDRVARLRVAVADGIFAALAPNLAGAGREELDCAAWHVFPGVIDSQSPFHEARHTHL